MPESLVPSPELPQELVIPPTPKKSPWLVILSVLLIIALTLLGYFSWQVVTLRSQLADKSAPSPTPTASADPTANWKTYTDNKLDFSFKYPPEYSVQISSVNGRPDPSRIDFGTDKGSYLTLFTGKLTTYDEKNLCTPESKVLPCISPDNSRGGLSVSETTLDNKKAKSLYVSEGTVDADYHVIFTEETPKIELRMFISGGGLDQTFNQILSTFKFNQPMSNDPNIKTFTSQKLGITFQYQEKYKGSNETIATKEIGNKVYIYSSVMKPDQGQYVEIFDKSPNDSLEGAITKTVMTGYSPTDCPIEITTKNMTGSGAVLPEKYTQALIKVPTSEGDDMEAVGQKATKCPKPYISVGGLAYFLADQNHPDKFVFFSIGQYALNAGDNITWEDTFKFIN